MQGNRPTYIHTDRNTGRQAERPGHECSPTYIHTNCHTGRQIYIHKSGGRDTIYIETNTYIRTLLQPSIQAGRQAGRRRTETYMHTARHTYIQTYIQAARLAYIQTK